MVGAIQSPDIIREELERVFQQSQNPKATCRFISLRVWKLAEWAGSASEDKVADNRDVSTPSPTKKVVITTSVATPTRPLKMSKVSPKMKPVVTCSTNSS